VLAGNPAGVNHGAGVTLTYQTAGQVVGETLLQMDDGAAAKQAIAGFTAEPTRCPSFSGVIGGLTVRLASSNLPDPPALGNQTVALLLTETVTVSGQTFTVDLDLVVIRRGSTILAVTANGGAFDELISTAVDAAYAKLVAHG
jgi:hypothetical protein